MTVKITFTEPQISALHSVLSLILSDPDWAEIASMSRNEWRALENAAEKIMEALE